MSFSHLHLGVLGPCQGPPLAHPDIFLYYNVLSVIWKGWMEWDDGYVLILKGKLYVKPRSPTENQQLAYCKLQIS